MIKSNSLLKGVLAAALIGAFSTTAGAAGAQVSPRPNVVFILTDDQNFDTIGCFGAKVLTPAMDRLAAGGVRFTRAYTVHSVCTPSRYVCLTGQYASRSGDPRFNQVCPPGTQSNVGFNVTLPPGSLTVAKVLHDAGYVTGFVGKWHTGAPQVVRVPEEGRMDDPKVAAALGENQRRLVEYVKGAGFDFAAGVYRGNLKDHKLDALDVHNQEWVTKGALDFLDRAKGKPFFLHVCTTLQHGPPPIKSLRAGKDAWRVTPAGLLSEPLDVQPSRESIFERVRAAGFDADTAHATWLDDGIAAILKKLGDMGVAENTLVLMFSDNGTRGGKGTCYEGGANTPSILYWKGHVPAGVVCGELVQNTDFVPTILDAAGVSPPESMHLDGRSLLPMVNDANAAWRDTTLLEVGHTRGVLTSKWKYIAVRYPPAMRKAIDAGTLGRKPYHMDNPTDLQITAERNHPAYWDADQLYDLEKDPGEKVNLAKDSAHAAVLADMKGRLKAKLAEFSRPFGEFNP
jgi:arylsulfatase A-like enzyme